MTGRRPAAAGQAAAWRQLAAARAHQGRRPDPPPLVTRPEDMPGLWPEDAVIVAQFTVPGPPRAKERARTVTLPDGRRHSYTPTETAAAEARVLQWLRVFAPLVRPEPGAVYGVIVFFWQADERRGRDGDNLAKLVLDALNGHAWPDDRHVPDLTVRRRLDPGRPRTEVTIYRVCPAVPETAARMGENCTGGIA
jgi:crossover junction endodeoxyribonuclease RusA